MEKTPTCTIQPEVEEPPAVEAFSPLSARSLTGGRCAVAAGRSAFGCAVGRSVVGPRAGVGVCVAAGGEP